eukprot:5170794-Alexandrium_andersonii.AAC.1
MGHALPGSGTLLTAYTSLGRCKGSAHLNEQNRAPPNGCLFRFSAPGAFWGGVPSAREFPEIG